MTIAEQILALLTGKKVFDGAVWHVFDQHGIELTDVNGVLWRGVHGALLWNVNALAQETANTGATAIPWGSPKPGKPAKKKTRQAVQNEAILLLLLR